MTVMRLDGPVRAWVDHLSLRPRSAAFVAGLASATAMAPFFLWPVLFLTLPLLVVLPEAAAADLSRASRFAPWRAHAAFRVASVGWWFGFGYHFAGLFWIGEAFLVEAEVFAWLLPFAVTLLPAGLALFLAAATVVCFRAAPPGLLRALLFSLALAVAEWLRGHIFTGLPWNVIGYALAAAPFSGGAAWFGIYGLTLVAGVVFIAGPIAWLVDRRARLCATLVIVPLLGLAGLTLVAHTFAQQIDAGPTPWVRIVQPSVVQREKWRPENQRRIFDTHLELSLTNASGGKDGASGIDLIVWPEAAMPFIPLEQPVALADIGRMLPAPATLVAGALRIDRTVVTGGRPRVYNSLLAFGDGDSARLIGTYDKTHLVPFGEYLPLQGLLEAVGLQQLTRLRGGFAAGSEPRALLDVPRVGRLAPLICYESIFPGRVVQSRERPRALLMVTNDGWFGDTTGPRQHLFMARVRAIEEGLPVIRAANNGISAMIDPLGRIVARLDLDVRGTIDAPLPPRLSPTPYARFGDFIFLGMCVMVAVVVGLVQWRRRLTTRKVTCIN